MSLTNPAFTLHFHLSLFNLVGPTEIEISFITGPGFVLKIVYCLEKPAQTWAEHANTERPLVWSPDRTKDLFAVRQDH